MTVFHTTIFVLRSNAARPGAQYHHITNIHFCRIHLTLFYCNSSVFYKLEFQGRNFTTRVMHDFSLIQIYP